MLKTRLFNLLPLAALAFALTLAGCDSGSADTDALSIGGTYSGTQTVDGLDQTMSLTIPTTESGGFAFTGEVAAQIDSFTVSIPLTGTGTYDHPDLSLTVTATIDGDPDTEQISGTVSASGDILTLDDGDITFSLTRE